MYLLKLNGIVGAHSERHLTKTIHGQDKDARVEIKLPEQWVYVETKVQLEKIKRALHDVGYTILAVEERP